MKEGLILKQTIDLSDTKISDIIDKSGIPRTTLYALFKEDKIKDEYKIRLEKAGIRPDYSSESSVLNRYSSEEILKQAFDAMKESVAGWKEAMDLFKQDMIIIKEDADIFKAIVKKGVEDGAIKFVNPKQRAV